MKFFEVFSELVEDLVDLCFCFLRRNEQTVSFEELIAQLKRDGKLMD